MNMRNPRRCRSSAFTLIELLVVIGLIGLMAGGLGVAMKNKNPGSALRSAQSILVSTLSAARSQSVLNQVDARILVNADTANTPYYFLREVKVQVQISGVWTEVGTTVVLPEGVYVVPPKAATVIGGAVTFVQPPSSENKTPTDDKYLSGFLNATTITLSGIQYYPSLSLTTLGGISGTTSTTGYTRMLVAAGTQTGAATVTLDNTSAVRGFSVSKYGVATVINNSDSF